MSAYLSFDTISLVLWITAVMFASHIVPGIFAPVSFFTHPLVYFGKQGLDAALLEGDEHVTGRRHITAWVLRSFSFWFFQWAAFHFAVLYEGPESCGEGFLASFYLAEAVFFLLSAWTRT